MTTQTPGQRLAELLKREAAKSDNPRDKKGKAVLSRKLGVGWQTVNRWCKDEGFDASNQDLVVRALGLPHDFFRCPDLALERETERESTFRDFVTTANTLPNPPTERELAFLSQIRFPDPSIQPTVEWYMLNLGVLRRAVTQQQAAAALAEAAKLDAEIESINRLMKKHGKKDPRGRGR